MGGGNKFLDIPIIHKVNLALFLTKFTDNLPLFLKYAILERLNYPQNTAQLTVFQSKATILS